MRLDKKELRTHLQYRWWMYLAVCIGMLTLWSTLYDIELRARECEKLRLVYVGKALNGTGLEEALTAHAADYTSQTLKELTVETVAYSDDYSMSILLYSRAAGMADVLLLPKSLLDEWALPYSNYMAELDEAAVRARFGKDVSLLVLEGGLYGIRVPENARLSAFCTDGDPLYVFIAPGSENAGGWSGKGDEAADAVLDALEWLLEAS